MKTSELLGAALGYACAIAGGINPKTIHLNPKPTGQGTRQGIWLGDINGMLTSWAPWRVWNQGGPIIEREHIQVSPSRQWLVCHTEHKWAAVNFKSSADATNFQHGPTPLIAAMRCFAISKLGDEIELPQELK